MITTSENGGHMIVKYTLFVRSVASLLLSALLNLYVVTELYILIAIKEIVHQTTCIAVI